MKAVVFDLDDTLYLERDYVKSGFKEVDAFLLRHDIAGFFSLASRHFEEGVRGNIFNVVLDELNVIYDGDYIGMLVDVYRSHVPAIRLLPDAQEIIKRLHGNYNLGLITDGFAVAQNKKVDALNLRALLDYIVITDELGHPGQYWKPHRKAYELVQNYFSIPGSDCVYVGDNVKKDFVSANALGWMTVQVCREGREHEEVLATSAYSAHYQIANLKELPKLLSKQETD